MEPYRTKNVKTHKRDSSKLSQIPAMNPLQKNCCRFLHVLHVADFESSLSFFFLLAFLLVLSFCSGDKWFVPWQPCTLRFNASLRRLLRSCCQHICINEIWNGKKSYYVTCTREMKENLNEETGDQQCLIVTFGRIPWRREGAIYWDLQLAKWLRMTHQESPWEVVQLLVLAVSAADPGQLCWILLRGLSGWKENLWYLI